MIFCLIFAISGVSANNDDTDNQVMLGSTDEVVNTISVEADTQSGSNGELLNSNNENHTIIGEQKTNILSANNKNEDINTLSSSENNVLTADNSKNDGVLREGESSGSFADLIRIIDLSSDTVELHQNFQFNRESDDNAGIDITKDNLIINGNGHTINGLDSAHIFNIYGNNVTLTNINIINAYSEEGAITWHGDNGKLDGATFKSCLGLEAGAVKWVGYDGIVNNVVFDSCKGQRTGGLLIQGGCKVLNTIFTECSVGRYYSSTMTSYWGAAMSITVNAVPGVVINCTFDKCTVSSTTTVAGYAGVLYAQRTQYDLIQNCVFTNNKINDANYGMISQCNAINYIDNCTFLNNSGVIFDTYYLNMNNCNFTNNTSPDLIYRQPLRVQVYNSIFDNFKITKGSATYLFYLSTGSSHEIINTSFNNINVNPIIVASPNFNIIGCNFSNIHADYNSIGNTAAPIIVNSNFAVIEDCIFTNTSGNTNGAITVLYPGWHSVIISNNTYNTYSTKPNVTSNLMDFDLKAKILYASPNGTGDGLSIDNCTNLTYALNNIQGYGTIYLTKGVYTFTGRQFINWNIIGYEDGVIINQGSFYQNSIGLVLKNIIFNDTRNPVFANYLCTIDNCTFNNTYSSSVITGDNKQGYGTVYSNLIFNNCDARNGNLLCTYEHVRVYNITVTDCKNINYIFYRSATQCNDVVIDNVVVTGSTFNGFAHAPDSGSSNIQFENWIMHNIYLIGNRINKELIYEHEYSKSSSIVNWYILGNRFTPTSYLFKYYDGLTLSDIHISDLTTIYPIIDSSVGFTLKDSSFNNVHVGAPLIEGSYNLILTM